LTTPTDPPSVLALRWTGLLTVIVATTACAACACSAQAATVTLGSPLGFPSTLNLSCPPGKSCTSVQKVLAGATLTSPIDGAVVRWHTLGATGSGFKLQVLRLVRDGTEPEFESIQSSAAVTPAGTGLETFPTAIPIKAGQVVGLTMPENGSVATRETLGAREMSFIPAVGDGSLAVGHIGAFDAELGFNAEVQPPPTVTGIGSVSGFVEGGNSVAISGTELEGASTVSFGDVRAAGYTVDSDGRITAVAPRVGKPTSVHVSVTTPAGTATSPDSYTYEERPREQPSGRPEEEPRGQESCTVPKLRGKRLKAARKILSRVHCRLGRLTRRKAASATAGRVIGQKPRPGKVLSAGTRVDLTLGR
jgi:hypothetical protein